MTSDVKALFTAKGADWLFSEDIVPYIYMRKENLFTDYGAHLPCDWFVKAPVFKNPLLMSDVGFANQILNLESKAFKKSGMLMPRWVFYDCAVMPGLVCGFAQKTSSLSESYKKNIGFDPDLEWTPLSLFIIIPTVRSGEWVAHNLCTSNLLVDAANRKYALGFLSKAFGLWYGNVEILCGVTQWGSPAIKLHSYYGPLEVLTAYTPVHSYAQTLTYRTVLDLSYWQGFFNEGVNIDSDGYKSAGFSVDPKSEASLMTFQRRIENGEGPFFLNPIQIKTQDLNEIVQVYLRT